MEKYLENPLFLCLTKVQLFDNLNTRVTHRIEGWKTKLLSQVLSTTLIILVTIVVPTYQMATLAIPKSISNKLNAIQR